MDQFTLELLQAASIENITIRDNAPVSATFTLPHGAQRIWSWQLNENFLDDTAVVAGVSDTLTRYFNENATYDMGEGMIWEGHKAVIWGELILRGARCKRTRQADFQKVLEALQQAELCHKRHGDPEALKRLLELRELFSRLLDCKVCRQLRYLSHKNYEYGNKCSRMLARALRKRRAQTHVHKLQSTSGGAV